MRKFPSPILLVMVALLTGCTGALSVTSAPATALPASTMTLPATPTHVPLSPTPAITSTPTIPPEARLKIHCLDVASAFPPQASSEGIIILKSEVIQGDYLSFDVFLQDMVTGTKTQLAKQNESLIYFTVSPDREKMAYNRILFDKPAGQSIKDQLIIATADGQLQKAIAWEQGWVGIPGWLDDERLIINMAGNNPHESAGKKAYTLLMLNPFTGQRRILRPDFPDILDQHPVFDWDGWGETVYDPTLTRVVYLNYHQGYMLWDLKARQALATLGAEFSHPPHWSPDGAQFVVASDGNQTINSGFELFSVSRDGQRITRLTNLTAYNPAADMWGYSWSPDGSHLAFWLSTDPDAAGSDDHAAQRLAVLDLATQEVTNYCLPLESYRGGDDAVPFFLSGTSPIWSPNGQQLIVESHYAKNASRVILVDIAQAFAVQIAENMMPAGWMKSGP